MRLLVLLLALMGWIYGHPPQKNLPTPPEALVCETGAYLLDFPYPQEPNGQRLQWRLRDDHCLPAGSVIMASDYSCRVYTLGQGYRLQLSFKAQSRWATVRGAEALPGLAGPFWLGWRAGLAELIDRRFAPENRRWLRAFLLGDRSQLQYSDQLALRQTGTTHLIAISGSHLVVFATLTYFLLIRLLAPLRQRLGYYPEPRTLALALTTLVCALYSLLTGLEPPVLRAWLMMFFFLCHWFWPLLGSGRQVLLLTAISQLLLFPEDLFSAASWLSYTAVLALMVAQPRLRRFGLAGQYVLLQIFVTLAMLPLTWALFGGISLWAIPANLALIVWTPLLLYGALLALLLPPLAGLIDYLAGDYFSFILRLGALENGYWEPAWQPHIGAGLALSLLLILVFSRLPHKKTLAAGLALLSLYFLWPSRQTVWTVPRAYPLALLRVEERFYVINGGLRQPFSFRDDFRRHFLPLLRQRGARPTAVILTSRNWREHSSLVSLRRLYPELAIYSLVPLPDDFPFPFQFCPPSAPGLKFIHEENQCAVEIGPHYLSPRGLEPKKLFDSQRPNP